MKKIITVGVIQQNNFGGPSILFGINELFRRLYDDYTILNYQKLAPDQKQEDIHIKTLKLKATPRKLLWWGLLGKCGIKCPDTSIAKILDEIRSADFIVDLFGICFCDNFGVLPFHRVNMVKENIGRFLIPFLGRLYKVKVIKNSCSYGPMESKYNKESARFANKYIFDIMVARERESEKRLKNVSIFKNKIKYAPDIANLVRVVEKKENEKLRIGISASYQILKQWKGTGSYIDIMSSLCRHILRNYDVDILFIPNEVSEDLNYDDRMICNKIIKRLEEEQDRIQILDVKKMGFLEQKVEIARCSLVIASRYHTCVASLSSGIPTLVIGWHDKYDELLKLYGQERWCIASKDCSLDKIENYFEDLWMDRKNIEIDLRKNYLRIEEMIMNVGREIFGCDQE